MKGFDAFAGVIKSGGKTRRAAKMVILNVDHPDIVDFIECKSKEEAKAHALIAAGYDGSSPDSEAYSSIFFQNANNSVRVTDDFMYAVVRDADFSTRAVKDGRPIADLQSQGPAAQDFRRHLALRRSRHAVRHHRQPLAHVEEHRAHQRLESLLASTCSSTTPPATWQSLNLMKFAPNGTFDVEAYRHAVDVLITAQEILVDNAGYPTEMIMQNSHDYRPLGLGYANLGALLMACGPALRLRCRTRLRCLRHRHHVRRSLSAVVAHRRTLPAAGARHRADQEGPRRHEPGLRTSCPAAPAPASTSTASRSSTSSACTARRSTTSTRRTCPPRSSKARKACWDEALAHGEKHGYRNSQVTVLAPTGTIGFMMDCDTTGIEPDLALVKYKKLVGGGMIKIVNNTVPAALFKLGYTHDQTNAIVSYIDATGTIEGAPAHQGRASCRLRLLLQAGEGHALHPLHGTPAR